MATDEHFEPAFAWVIMTTVGSMALGICALLLATHPDATPGLVSIPSALAVLAVGHFLTAVGITGAMAEPLPRKPSGGRAPLRLRISWGLLGLLPPPGRGPRMLPALLLSAGLLVYSGPTASIAAFAVVVSAWLLGKPASVLTMESDEKIFHALLWVLGGAGLLVATLGLPDTVWLGVAVLAAHLALVGQRCREVTALRWAELLPGVAPPPALDLSRYELSVERRGPAERTPLPEGVEAQLVDSGSFRVDAGKMLEKLRQYQLRDPRDFILAWLRCAVASGATRLDLTTTRDGFELRFDGRAFSSAELSQPYQVLVDGEGRDAERGRHFAYGLLGLYRLSPRAVSVTSRGKGGVAALGIGGAAADPDAAPSGTAVSVRWPPWASWWRPWLVARRAKARWGLCAARFAVNGRPVEEEAERWSEFKKEGWRGRWHRSLAASHVGVYLLGTLVDELDDGPAGVTARLTHDDLRLDISQSAVVRGTLLNRGLRLLANAAK